MRNAIANRPRHLRPPHRWPRRPHHRRRLCGRICQFCLNGNQVDAGNRAAAAG